MIDYRRPTPVLHSRWRTGHGTLERFIHLQEGETASADDPIIGQFDSPTVAAKVVRLWNDEFERRTDGES